MSEMNPIEREQKKKQLRGRVIDTATQDMFPRRGISHGENEEEVAEKAERHSRRKRLRRVLTAVLIAALLAAGFMYYKDNHAYTDYTVAWEKEIAASESSTTEFVPFGENVLKYTKDGASYLDKSGKAVWSMSYELKSPICYVNGDYAVIGDQQGNDIYIVDKTGSQGKATTLLPILRVSVSAYGIVAALVEDSNASYVTFFKKDGSELDWAIKTVMSGNGYRWTFPYRRMVRRSCFPTCICRTGHSKTGLYFTISPNMERIIQTVWSEVLMSWRQHLSARPVSSTRITRVHLQDDQDGFFSLKM